MTLLGCWVMWRDARDLLELKPKAKLRESELVFVEPHLGLFVGETFTQCYLRREARSQERNGGRRWRTGGTFELREIRTLQRQITEQVQKRKAESASGRLTERGVGI